MRPIALILALIPAIWPVCAPAQDWQALKGAQIRAALAGRQLDYASGSVQDFRASGRTLYSAGADSWGYWRVQGDQYCSMWPPSDLWACYDLLQAGNRLRFVGAAGDTTDAGVRP